MVTNSHSAPLDHYPLPHPPSPPVSGNTSGEGREGGVLNEGLMREGKRWVSGAAFESARAAGMAESSQRVAWEKKQKKNRWDSDI